MNWQQLCAIGRGFPGVTVETWYRTPALKVRGKGFVRLKEDGASVVFILDSLDEQEALLDAKPDVYYITDHYRGWASVLARLSKLTLAEARVRLERSWRTTAPAALIAELDGKPATKPRTSRKPKARTSASRAARPSSRGKRAKR